MNFGANFAVSVRRGFRGCCMCQVKVGTTDNLPSVHGIQVFFLLLHGIAAFSKGLGSIDCTPRTQNTMQGGSAMCGDEDNKAEKRKSLTGPRILHHGRDASRNQNPYICKQPKSFLNEYKNRGHRRWRC